jgi:CRP-like cAMP-binding protein
MELTKNEVILISRNPLFKEVPLADIPEALACLGAEKRAFEKESFLFEEGDEAQIAYLVLKGAIDLVRYTPQGERRIFESFKEGEIFGEAYAVKEHATFGVSAYAKENGLVLSLRLARLYEPDDCGFATRLLKNLVISLADKDLMLKQKLTVLTQKGLEEKVLEFLSSFSSHANQSFLIPFSREEMADYLGCERSALSRLLSNMAKKKLIAYDKNSFRILKNPRKNRL